MALILLVLAFAAFCVSAIAGGGAGLVLLPVLRTLLPVEQTPVALSLGTLTGSAARLHAFRVHVRWDVVRVFVPMALPFAALGAWLMSSSQPAYVDLLIALFLLSNLPAALSKKRMEKSLAPAKSWQLRLVAMLAGFISGFTGSVGLLFNGFYRRLGISKDELIATRAANEIGLQLLRVVLYSAFGLMRRETVLAGGLVAVAAVLAAYACSHFVKRIREDVFRRISDVSMLAAGLAMITLSSGQILKIHHAWAQSARVVDDQEFQLYWQGHLHFSVEIESGRWPILERSVSQSALPAVVTARLPAASIISVEEIYSLRRHRYEVVYRPASGGLKEMEIIA